MSVLLSRWLPLAFIALAALWLRITDLGARPMHADEANQAVKLGELLEHGRYAFDPVDHHGPTLYYFALPVAWARGEKTLAALTETTVRLTPAIMGTVGVVLLAFLALPLGRWPAFGAAALMAVAPASVYYSRYFIQETLLVTFTLGLLLCGHRWWRSGRLGWAIAAGACAGLMQATKASAPLFAVAALAALLLVRRARPAAPRLALPLGLAFATAVVVAAVFYSSFGTHLSGLRDALATYAPTSSRAAGGSGHEKPWWYYLNLFGWQRVGGLLWQQLAFSVVALAGVVVAFSTPQKFLRWAAVYTLIVLVALSLPPYKTPWHAVHLVPGLALLAAGALAAMPVRLLGVAVTVCLLAVQCKQTNQSSFLRPADGRNPFAYVHTSPDALKIPALAAGALQSHPNGLIRVISEEYWPIPWYLRAYPQVGYWPTAPADCDGALIIASVAQATAVRARLHGEYRETYLGLRPGFLCVAFTPLQTP